MTRQMTKHRLLPWLLVVVFTITSALGTGSVFASTDNHMRLAGQDRFGTSAAISEKLIADDQAEAIVLVNGLNFADALAAGPFATEIGAPILMVNGATGNINETVINEINRIDSDHNADIYIIGGPGAVNPETDILLQSIGYSADSIGRIFGDSRYETAVAVAERIDASTVFIAYGGDFPDALGGGSAAAVNDGVILFTGKNYLDASTKAYIQNKGIKNVMILGGEGVVSKSVENELKGLGSGMNVNRAYGAGRCETSVDIAQKFFPETQTIVVATAFNYADALAGGPLAAYLDAPIILVDTINDRIGEDLKAYIRSSGAENLVVLGGEGAVSESLYAQLQQLLVSPEQPDVPDVPETDPYEELVAAKDAALAAMNEAAAARDEALAEKVAAETENADAETALEDAQTDLAAANADITAAKAELDTAKAELKVAEEKYAADVKDAEKKIEEAQAEYDAAGESFIVDNCMVYEDIDGILTDSYTVWKVLMKNNVTLAPYVNDKFESTMAYQFKPENIRRYMDFIDECNVLRAGEGRSALEVDFDLMLLSGISNAVSSQAGFAGGHLFAMTAMQDSNLQDILLNASGGGFAENLAFGYSDPYNGWYYDEKAAYDAGEREQQKIGHYLSIISQDYHVTGFAMSQNRVAEQSFGIYEGLGITTKVFRSLLDEHTAAEKAKLDNAKETLATLSGDEVAAAKDNVKAKQAAYDQAVKTAETAESAVKAAKTEAEKAAAALQEAAAAYEDAVKDYNEKEAAYEEAAKAVEEYAKENN